MTSYYPIRTLSFAIDYQFWELNPRGYKLTNVLIHIVCVQLCLFLALRLLSRYATKPQLDGGDVAAADSAEGASR